MSPAILRTLIYSSIYYGNFKLPEDKRIERSLLVQAELLPEVWGRETTSDIDTRTMGEEESYLHLYGLCLSCKETMWFPSGDTDPLKFSCTCCKWENNKLTPISSVPFHSTFCDWPMKYQKECISILTTIRHSK